MTLVSETILIENEQYRIVIMKEKDALLFDWKTVEGLSAEEFRQGILTYAGECKSHRPTKAAINAVTLDQNSQAIAWLRGNNDDQTESYDSWWMREVVPLYHSANITALSVATGDPNAPGELPNTPPDVRFKIGYFPDLDTAINW